MDAPALVEVPSHRVAGVGFQSAAADLVGAAIGLNHPAHPQAATHAKEGKVKPFWFDKRFIY